MKISGKVPPRRLLGWAVLFISFVVFLVSPVRDLADSRYALLVSQSLLEHGTFTLDAYFSAPSTRTKLTGRIRGTLDLQLEEAGGHVYYSYPPGTSVLSLPLVALLRVAGVSASDSAGRHDPAGEIAMQGFIAALLMAILAGVFYATALHLLPPAQSAMVALGSAFGTQIWSTSSRGMWAHTWEILLLGILIWMLVRHQTGHGRLPPVILGSLAAWLYFVRPTGLLPSAGLTVYLLANHRGILLPYAWTALLWLSGFFVYSWIHFQQLLPAYYRLSPTFDFQAFRAGLLGTLFSPGRGLLVFVPVLGFVAWLLVRYRRRLPFRRLAWLAIGVCTAHFTVVSFWQNWWGGNSYGPRLSTCLVPWMVLLAKLGLRARQDARDSGDVRGRGRIEKLVGVVLLLLSMLMNGAGAISKEARSWNVKPFNVDRRPARLWDWRHPQFLAAWSWPLPQDYLPLPIYRRIEPGTSDGDLYLWGGWVEVLGQPRWTNFSFAELIFAAPKGTVPPTSLGMKLEPFLVPMKLHKQRVDVFLNGERLGTVVLRRPTAQVVTLRLPPWLIREHNTLKLRLPNAKPSKQLGVPGESRALRGVALWWLELH